MGPEAKMARVLLIVAASSLALLAGSNPAAAPGGEVVMLEEITIKLEAELPTVMVTIGRQEPEVRSSELERPLENLLVEGATVVRPKAAEFEINKIENPKKMIAKVREP